MSKDPEMASSSSARSYLWPLCLLGILAFVSWFRSKSGTPIQKSNYSINPKPESHEKEQGAAQFSSLSLQVPPSNRNTENACQCCHYKTPWWRILLDILIVLSTASAAGAAIYYAHITKRMWSEMQTQTATGQKQLEQSERAWLTVDITADTGFEFTVDGGARISIRPHIHNIGQSPATAIVSSAKLILAPMNGNGERFFREPINQQNELCDKIAKAPISAGKTVSQFQQVIFPTAKDESLIQGLAVSKAEIDAAKTSVMAKSGPEFLLSPFIVGCVDYQYATAIQHHQTGFIYGLQHHDRTLPPNIYPIRAIRVGHSINTVDVEIQKWPFGGFYAY